MFIRIKALGVGLLLTAGISAQASAQLDSTRRAPLFSGRDAAILGVFALGTLAIAPLDTRIAAAIQDPGVQQNGAFRRAAIAVETIADPGAVVIGLGMYSFGKLTRNERAADLGLHGIEALFIGSQVGGLLKGIVGRARPYVDVTNPNDYQSFRGFSGGSDYKSFPSGHTIAAFAAASAVTFETRRWWPKSVWYIGPLMYAGATTVGLSRMYDNKHWASDVVMGAAIGSFVGQKVVQWHHARAGNRVDRFFLGASADPLPDGQVLMRLHFAPGF